MKRRSLICFVLIISMLALLFSFSANADTKLPENTTPPITEPDTDNPEPDIRTFAKAYGIFCVDTDMMLISSAEQESCYAYASVKLLNALVASEMITDLSQTVEISSSMLKGLQGNAYGYKSGMSVSYSDLLKALIIRDANDAALILANTLSTDTSEYVKLLNDRAKELGMSRTVIHDVTGVSEKNTTNISDMIILLEALIENDYVLSLSGTRYTKLDSSDTIYSRNYFLSDYYNGSGRSYVNRNILGGFSFHSAELGDTLLSVAKQGSYTYLIAVSGAQRVEKTFNSYLITEDLFTYASVSFEYRVLLSDAQAICNIDVEMGNGHDKVTVFPSKKVIRYIDKSVDIESVISFDYTLDIKKLTAPVSFGQRVGTLYLYYDGALIEEIDLITRADIASSSSDYLLSEVVEFLQSDTFSKTVIGTSVICITYVLTMAIYRGQKQRKLKKQQDGENRETNS